jgi:hypothetical protein
MTGGGAAGVAKRQPIIRGARGASCRYEAGFASVNALGHVQERTPRPQSDQARQRPVFYGALG